MTTTGFGIDVGGSGVKGGTIDLSTGEMIGDRIKILTPQPSHTRCDSRALSPRSSSRPSGPVRSASLARCRDRGRRAQRANIDKSWIDTDAAALFGKALGGREVTVLNDADAAGNRRGLVRSGQGHLRRRDLVDLRTGIGSAVLHNGVLLPNTEFGHLEVDGKEAEHRAASSVKEKKDWSYKEWAVESPEF